VERREGGRGGRAHEDVAVAADNHLLRGGVVPVTRDGGCERKPPEMKRRALALTCSCRPACGSVRECTPAALRSARGAQFTTQKRCKFYADIPRRAAAATC
jgi:hypothetical protein